MYMEVIDSKIDNIYNLMDLLKAIYNKKSLII